MAERRLPPTTLLIFLFATVFGAVTVANMFTPLLVELAKEFRTSVAMTGQLAAAMPFTWALTALAVGPVSDIYGRRLIVLVGLMIMVIGTLSSALAWNFVSLLAFGFLTGVGGAMVPPNCFATVLDIFPPERRGKALGWVMSAIGLSMTFGVPIVALLTDVGGWRPPFYVVGGFLLVLWGLLWVWFPGNKPQPGHTSTYISHLRAVGSKAVFWYALLGNFLQLVAFMGMFRYLAAYLIQIYYMKAGKTAFPLMLTGLGVITGTIMGGRVAGHRHRLALISICFLVGGLIVPLLFVTHISPWITVGMSFCITSFLSISWPVLARLSTEMAGKSRATAMGMLAMSNQFAGVVGASIGGVMLSLGSFPLVGIFCCATAAAAAVVVRYKVRESA